jgi:menaquinone-dependent protoporphyrinogen oxidase
MGSWLPEARNFVEHHRVALSELQVWLFSSGPLGTDNPQPHEDPNRIVAPMDTILARSHKVFVGKLDPAGLGFGERFAAKLVHAPYGDFRDWDDVRRWARGDRNRVACAHSRFEQVAEQTTDDRRLQSARNVKRKIE